MAVVLLHLGRFDMAVEEMEQAVGLAPSHAHIAALAAYVHRYAGNPGRAIDLLDRAMRLSPGHPPWYLNTRAAALWATGRSDAAEIDLRTAQARDPASAITLVLLASLLGQSGRSDAGRDVVGKLLEIDPGFSAEAWLGQNPYRHDADRRFEIDGLLASGAPR